MKLKLKRKEEIEYKQFHFILNMYERIHRATLFSNRSDDWFALKILDFDFSNFAFNFFYYIGFLQIFLILFWDTVT